MSAGGSAPQFPYGMMQNQYQLPQQPQAAQGMMTGANTMAGQGQQSLGQFNAAAPGLMQNAQQQGGVTQNVGNQVTQPLLATAFDPQNALFNQQQQLLQDQTRSAEAAQGIAGTPYGAGVEANAMGNFDINWQNQQLQRQLQGISGATQAQGMAQSGANMPLNTLGALGQAQNAYTNPTQQAVADYTGYLGAGQNAANSQNQMLQNAFSSQNQQWQQQQQQQNQMLGGLGSLFGGGLGTFGSAAPGSLFGRMGTSLFG